MKYTLDELLRYSIGFDPSMFGQAQTCIGTGTGTPGYPPYDIEKVGEYEYRVTLAVAGFAPDELEVTTVENQLEITGEKKASEGEAERKFLHHGIAQRRFKRTFTLAEFVRVIGAKTENGLLIVDLVRELPEDQKPRTIEIKTA